MTLHDMEYNALIPAYNYCIIVQRYKTFRNSGHISEQVDIHALQHPVQGSR